MLCSFLNYPSNAELRIQRRVVPGRAQSVVDVRSVKFTADVRFADGLVATFRTNIELIATTQRSFSHAWFARVIF
jgi:hypothetical protein